MSNRNTIFVLAGSTIAAIILFFSTSLSDSSLCNGEHETMQCFAESRYPRLVSKSFDPVIDRAIIDVKTDHCADPNLARNTYLVLSALIPLSAHLTEETMELTDRLLTEDPRCFLNSIRGFETDRLLKLRIVLSLIEAYKDELKSGGRKSLEAFRDDPELGQLVKALMTPATNEEMNR